MNGKERLELRALICTNDVTIRTPTTPFPLEIILIMPVPWQQTVVVWITDLVESAVDGLASMSGQPGSDTAGRTTNHNGTLKFISFD